jgi:hypothetical protein
LLAVVEGAHLLRAEVEHLDRLDQAQGAQLRAIGMEALVEGVVRRLHVVGARGGGGVGQGQAFLAARLVHGELLAFDVQRERHRAGADSLGGPHDPIGQEVADALTTGYHGNELRGGVLIAEAQVDAVRVLLGQ